MKTPTDLLYSKEHEWVRVEGEIAYVGISDYAQSELGDIVYVELPEVGEDYEVEESFGVVESVKAVSDLYMPISGTIMEVNEDLEDQPELINEDAYENWIIKVKIADKSELDDLLSGKEYQEFCAKEE
ncbi:MAG TPA: glycine cleavage system protein GcvH [Eubacteriaceae bacterium]|jgi:glycine cleavage system H protein|nr:glycine cleavage system protein GcvH [Eubacteriaceae bacterium]